MAKKSVVAAAAAVSTAALIAAATSKRDTAAADIDKAKAAFAEAQTDEARKEAQDKLNAAAAELETSEKELANLQAPARAKAGSGDEDDGPSYREFRCVGAIKHNGDWYEAGDPIALTKEEYDALPVGSVV